MAEAKAAVCVIIDEFQMDKSDIIEEGRILRSRNTSLRFPLHNMKIKAALGHWSNIEPWDSIRSQVFPRKDIALNVRVSIKSEPSFLSFEGEWFQFDIHKPADARDKSWRELYGVAEITEEDVTRAFEYPISSDFSYGAFYRRAQLDNILRRFFQRSATTSFTSNESQGSFDIILKPVSMSECTIRCGYQPGEVPITQATATWVVNGECKSVILLLNLKEVLNLFLGTPFDPSKLSQALMHPHLREVVH